MCVKSFHTVQEKEAVVQLRNGGNDKLELASGRKHAPSPKPDFWLRWLLHNPEPVYPSRDKDLVTERCFLQAATYLFNP